MYHVYYVHSNTLIERSTNKVAISLQKINQILSLHCFHLTYSNQCSTIKEEVHSMLKTIYRNTDHKICNYISMIIDRLHFYWTGNNFQVEPLIQYSFKEPL